MDHYSIFESSSPEKDQKKAAPETVENTNQGADAASPAATSPEISFSEPQQEPAREPAELSEQSTPPVPPTAESLPGLDGALQALVQKAQYVSNASGAAIALRQGSDVVCRAASGSSAPDRGARLQIRSGLTAECLRSGELLRCDNVMLDQRVDIESCKRLGIESIIITPLRHKGKLAGVLELFCSHAYSFQERDVETVKSLAEEAGRILDGEEETIFAPPQAAATVAAPVEEARKARLEEGQGKCTNCGAAISSDTVFCTECGFFQEGAPGKRTQAAGWKSRVTGRRLLVPAAFVAMALVVAIAPIPHTANSGRVAPTRQAVLSAPAPLTAQPGKPAITSQPVSPVTAGASAPTGDNSPAAATNPSIAKSVKQLLGGVSSDFSKLLPVNEAAEPPSNGDPNLRVWVDTRKGFYYCPGDEQYGRTGKGSYMTQKDAESNYYIPAMVKPCT